MKINWKVIIAVVVIIGTVFWAASSIRTRSYSGSELIFPIGSGTIKVTNPSEETLPVQFSSERTGVFTVASTIPDVAGRSTRQGTGRNTTQLFEFQLPPGVSEFTVLRSSGVSFVSSSPTRLEASVQPVDAGEARTLLIATAVVVGIALYVISSTTGHRWIGLLRGKTNLPAVTPPVAVSSDGGQGRALKAYGDNRESK